MSRLLPRDAWRRVGCAAIREGEGAAEPPQQQMNARCAVLCSCFKRVSSRRPSHPAPTPPPPQRAPLPAEFVEDDDGQFLAGEDDNMFGAAEGEDGDGDGEEGGAAASRKRKDGKGKGEAAPCWGCLCCWSRLALQLPL
jgi:hypothetical protein